MKKFFTKGWETGIGMFEDNVFRNQKKLPALALRDRRQEPRISISLPVQYRLKGKIEEWIGAKTLDVSRNGVRLATSTPVQVGHHIDLYMKLPEESKTLYLEGVVVWVSPSINSATISECGVSFGDLRHVSRKEKIIRFMADRLCQLALQYKAKIICRPAETLDELKAAYGLAYREYLARGYCLPNASQMHYTYFCLLPDSRTFLLERGSEVLGTISLIPDSPCGIPMESLFPDEIGGFRGPDRRLAEVSLLALKQEAFGKKCFSLTDYQKLVSTFHLFKMTFDYAWSAAGVTDLMITMNPKHVDLYRYLGFEPIGPVKAYAGACGKPALPMHLDVLKTRQKISHEHGVGSYFLHKTTPEEILKKHHTWSSEDARNFLKDYQPLWEKLPPAARNHLKQCYPEL